jgi:uncharacterized membrane protein YbhN (UPF0104 family)
MPKTPKQKQSSRRSLAIRLGLSVVLLVGAAWVLARNWDTVHRSLQLARGASIGWLVASVVLMAATFLIAAAIYGALALHRLRYQQTVVIEVATAFVNRLVPSGLGGLGLHGLYLYRRGHTPAEATVVVSVNNLLGIAAHFMLLAAVTVVYPSVWHQLLDDRSVQLPWWLPVILVTVVAVVLMLSPVRRRLRDFVRNLLRSVRKLRPLQLVCAALWALTLTVTYTCILFATVRSLGLDLGLVQTFIVFSIGMLASTATPTPGGLVGAEAGLFAGLVAYDVSSPTAGAIVLLYRLVTYWLPILPGVAALLLARRRKLV